MNKVLVISRRNDEHIELVSKLSSMEFVVFDPSEFIDNLDRLSFYIDSSGIIHGMYENYYLNDFQVFWYRKPLFVREDEYPVPEGLREHCRDNYMRLMDTLFSAYKDRFWVNHPDDNRYAENKLRQLVVARRVGFKISNTLFSNSAQDANKFIHNKKTVVAKTLGQRRVKFGDDYLNAPLTEISTSEKLSEDLSENELGLRLNPHIFQEYSKGCVHRVIVINGKVISMKTIPLNPETPLDSRVLMLSEKHSINVESTLPDSLKQMCFEYLRIFNLKYGAFDFIELDDGSFLFLECNPNGQWGFVDIMTEKNTIATEFARLFESV